MRWLARHAAAIEACAAAITAFVAVAALIGVKLQLDHADALQRAQSARDAYRGHLALAVASPRYAAPTDGCALLGSDEGAAYSAFVDHLLYSAEQMLDSAEGWETTFAAQLPAHAAYLCAGPETEDYSAPVAALLTGFRIAHCDHVPRCTQ